jgi:hypothetical protein
VFTLLGVIEVVLIDLGRGELDVRSIALVPLIQVVIGIFLIVYSIVVG